MKYRIPIRWSCSAAPGDLNALDQALDLLLAAKRPVILIGQGGLIGEATESPARISEASCASPSITSPNGKGTLDETHELSFGPMGRNGPYAANEGTRNADVILGAGLQLRRPRDERVDQRLHADDPADQADPDRQRPVRDRAQLPGASRHPGRRAREPRSAGAPRARKNQGRAQALRRLGRQVERVQKNLGRLPASSSKGPTSRRSGPSVCSKGCRT